MVACSITDVSGVVQAEIDRMSNGQENFKEGTTTINAILDVAKSYMPMEERRNAMQASPISVSSNGS